MSSISQSSLRALGCIRLRSRARPGALHIPFSGNPAGRHYAQLAPQVEYEEHEDQDIEDHIQDISNGASNPELYGREFVNRHLQELDKAQRSKLAETKQGRDTSLVWKRGKNAAIAAPRLSGEVVGKPEDSASERTTATSVKGRRSTTHSNHSHKLEAATREARDTIPSNTDNLAAELSGILTSTPAIANPSAALERALSHHREHISGSSVHTYNTLLAYSARISNYHGMRKIFRDMQKGNVQWNEETRKIVTKATMRGPGGGTLRGETRELHDSSTKNEPDRQDTRQAGDTKGGVDSLPGLLRRVEAPGTSISDAERRIALNAGYWKSETLRRSQDVESNSPTDIGSDSSRSPSSRTSSLQGALSPAEARSHLPPLDEQLSPTLFLAFLRYILACNPQPPSLADSYTALIALDREGRLITSAHLRHLAHLYLHPSLYASFRPFWVIREIRRLSKDGSIAFAPTSETLEKALLSLRQRRNRHRRAVELVDYFRRKWGQEIVDITCWRLVGRYALEAKDKEMQLFAIEGGNEALARQIERSKAPGLSAGTMVDASAITEGLFPQHGLDRRKWGRVRQAIVRHQSQARRAAADTEVSPPPTIDE